MTRFIYAFIAALYILGTMQAIAQENMSIGETDLIDGLEVSQIAGQISNNVQFLQTGGEWENGNFRVMIIRGESDKQHLFIEWQDNKSDVERTLASYIIEIKEVSELSQKIISLTVQEAGLGELTVFLDAEASDDPNAPFTYELFIFNKTEYTFDAASN